MRYPQTYDAETGVSTFTIEGVKYVLHPKDFAEHDDISKMLDAAFEQGKYLQHLKNHRAIMASKP